MRATSIMSMPMPRIISIVSPPVVRHQPQHLLHRGLDPHRDGAADDGVADVQLDQVRHAMEQRKVPVIQAVPGVDLQAERVCLLRSEEHTSELQSRQYLVCRLLLEKKKT